MAQLLTVPKRARANYMEGQALLRREFEQKRSEKGHDKLLDEMLWGAPRGGKCLQSHGLIDIRDIN